MTVTFKHDLDSVKMNQRAKYVSIQFNLLSRHRPTQWERHTHTVDRLRCLDHWSSSVACPYWSVAVSIRRQRTRSLKVVG